MPTPIWAPWRMEYLEGHRATECIFCEYPARSPDRYRESLVLVATEHALVILNRFPYTPSHLMVAPRRHVADIAGLDDVEYAAFNDLVRAAVIRLRNATGAQAMNIGMNLGKAAGAGIADHVHMHAVPRWEGDTNFMPVIADVRVMPEYLDAAWRRLYPHFTDVPGTHAPAP